MPSTAIPTQSGCWLHQINRPGPAIGIGSSPDMSELQLCGLDYLEAHRNVGLKGLC
jgi:hypothetical protein